MDALGAFNLLTIGMVILIYVLVKSEKTDQ
jgi:hypothetical protein